MKRLSEDVKVIVKMGKEIRSLRRTINRLAIALGCYALDIEKEACHYPTQQCRRLQKIVERIRKRQDAAKRALEPKKP